MPHIDPRNKGKDLRRGHRPRNDLSSVRPLPLGLDFFPITSEQILISSSPITASAWQSEDNNLSTLGDSTSLFNSPSGVDFSYTRAGSPQVRFGEGFTHSPRSIDSPSFLPKRSPSYPSSLSHSRQRSTARSSSVRMVTEREPPKVPSSPSKHSQYTQGTPGVPEFGKASKLQSPLQNSYFNIPKPGQPRPEHHRTNLPSTAGNNRAIKDVGQGFRVPLQQYAPVTAQVIVNKSHDNDVVEIARPAYAAGWSTYSDPRPRPEVYSSFADNVNAFSTVNKTDSGHLGRAVDLTDTIFVEDRFGAPDPFDYLDAGKATENIKALLEGVFEDDEDKPKTRGRKKKLQEKAEDLVDKLQELKVGADTKDRTENGEEDQEEEAEEDGSVQGLKVKLLPHQVEGVDWMRDKEIGLKKKKGILPKGGILADDMGLGKTIQSIALILLNTRPPLLATTLDAKADKRKLPNSVGKGTLVVAPLALIKQWEAEIANRVENSHKLRVCVHHGPQRTKRFEDLRKYDVVITTYQILVSEHGSSADTSTGPQVGCFGIDWYRVILDEAHTIKNRNAKATQACYALRAEYRWCLTGTPMQNNLDELQSLIKFLRIKPYDQLSVWRDQITRPMSSGQGGVAMKRLQFYLKAFMKRRTKDILKAEGALNPGGKVNSDGKSSNGFKITERKITKVVATFTEKERTFYEHLEQRTDKSLEQMMGGHKLNYASALVLLLRLRQACNHPELVGLSMAKDKDALTTGNTSGSQSPKKSNLVDKDLDDVADLLGGLSMQTKQCDVCQLELTKEEVRAGSIRCNSCETDLVNYKRQGKRQERHKKHPRGSQITKPPNQRSRRRNRPTVQDSDDDENEEGEGEWVVPNSRRQGPNVGKAGGSDDENAEGGGEWLASDDSDTGDEASVQILGSHRKKVTSVNATDGEDDSTDTSQDEDEVEDSPDEYSHAPFPTSSKIQHLLKILRSESAEHKFIVFSQFTSMLDLVEPFLKKTGLIYTRYDGSMRNDHREASLERLRNEKKTRILLCSLKCGSLGLNLTAASRVVILEPFWNPFVEEQAIDRVHRLNQTVDVVVYKITIADSVEERILDLQEKKRALAEAAIEGKAVAKLSMQDILKLFKRDAEHDLSHNTLPHLGVKTKVLPVAGSNTGTADSGRRSTPPAMEYRSGAIRVKEDPVYGRRW